jgi:hypothetical protein
MARLIEYRLSDGEAVLVEVADDSDDPGLQPAGRGAAPAPATKTFEAALDTVMPAAERTIGRLRSLTVDTIQLEFGIKFNTKAGAIIASTALEANLKVTLTWNRESATEPPQPVEAQVKA